MTDVSKFRSGKDTAKNVKPAIISSAGGDRGMGKGAGVKSGGKDASKYRPIPHAIHDHSQHKC